MIMSERHRVSLNGRNCNEYGIIRDPSDQCSTASSDSDSDSDLGYKEGK